MLSLYPSTPRSFTRLEAEEIGEAVRPLPEILAGRAKRLTAKPDEPWICAACLQHRHTACVSDRCACGRKHQ